jgi:hypothetical protein
MILQRTQPAMMITAAKKRFGRKTAILVTNASQKPVTATTGFITSSFVAAGAAAGNY